MLFLGQIEDNVLHPTVQYAAKVVDLHSTDATALFHTVDGGTADTVLVDQCVGADILPL